MEPRKRMTERVFISKIFPYSARKKRANGPAAYSTLKPETSSDSPSARSNGARLVSAKVDRYHIAARGHIGIASHDASWAVEKVCKVKFPANTIVQRRIRPRLTS